MNTKSKNLDFHCIVNAFFVERNHQAMTDVLDNLTLKAVAKIVETLALKKHTLDVINKRSAVSLSH